MSSNNRGFTLVELLAVIIIMGVITIMAIPGLKYLQDKNTLTKFIQYKDFIVESGRLYTDSYSEDMFGFNGKGCYIINYNELKNKKLIKDFSDNNVSCSSPDTFVKVEKNGNNIKYTPSIKCINKKGAVVYNNITTKCRNYYSKVPTIKIDIEYPNRFGEWSAEKKFIIHLHSDVGFIDNISLKYGFNTNNRNVPANLTTKSFHNNYGVKDLKFEFLESGHKNGKYYLYIDGTDAVNTEGFSANTMWSVELSYDTTPPTKPTVYNKFVNRWYNKSMAKNEDYVIKLHSTDEGSGIREFRYRFPNRSSEWISYYNSNHDYFTTTPFVINRNEIVQFKACDNMGYCSDIAESKIMIDTIAPNINRSISSKNAWTRDNVTVYTETSDNLSGFNNIYYGYSPDNVNNHSWTNISGNKASVMWNYEYQRNVYVRAIDNAGNSTLGLYAGKVLIDRTKPVINSVYNNSNGNWTKNSVTITANAIDNASGISRYYYGYDTNNINYSDISTIGNDMKGTWYGARNSPVYIAVKDKAGNISDYVSANYVRIIKSKPSCSFTTSTVPDSYGRYSTGTTVYLNAADNSLIKNFNISTGSNTINGNSVTLNDSGSINITGKVTDMVGNVATCSKTISVISELYCDIGTLSGDICVTREFNYRIFGYCCSGSLPHCKKICWSDKPPTNSSDRKPFFVLPCPLGFHLGYDEKSMGRACIKPALRR